jgi:PAS domain S-box-containing protein
VFPIRPGVGKKLLGLALFHAAAFALIAVIAATAFNRVEILATDIARNQMTGVLENASIARELSTALSEIDLISRSCRSGSASEDTGKHMSAALLATAQRNQDKQQAEAIAALSTTATELLEQCAAIRRVLLSLDGIDRQILAELATLENLIGRILIDQTLSGKSTDYLDQIMNLITGFRETVLQIGKNIAERAVLASADPKNGNPNVALIDDLNLRLQTLTASSPEIARIARRTIRLTVAYRREILELDIASHRFHDAITRSHAAQTTVLKTMSRLDEQASGRVSDLGLQIHQAIAAASRWVFGLSVLIALLSFLAIAVIVRRSIKRPLHKVLQHIDAVRHGTAIPDVGTPGRDEWGTIHTALFDMTAALASSRSLLQSVVDTAPMRVFWKDRDLRYLGCNPAFARDAGKTHPEELLGKDDYQMGWAKEAERYRADDQAVMDSGVARLFFVEPQTTPDGRTIWLRTSKVPLRDSNNQTIGILGVYEDITERKRIERRLDMAIKVTQVILWELDLTDGHLAYDRAMLPVLGLTPDEELDSLQHWVARVHPDDRTSLPGGRCARHPAGGRNLRLRVPAARLDGPVPVDSHPGLRDPA